MEFYKCIFGAKVIDFEIFKTVVVILFLESCHPWKYCKVSHTTLIHRTCVIRGRRWLDWLVNTDYKIIMSQLFVQVKLGRCKSESRVVYLNVWYRTEVAYYTHHVPNSCLESVCSSRLISSNCHWSYLIPPKDLKSCTWTLNFQSEREREKERE